MSDTGTVTTSKEPTIEQRLRALRRANAKMIEQELYHYRWSRTMLATALRELDLLADSTVMPSPPDQDRVQTSRYLSDIVAERAERLMDERRYTVAVLYETARRLDAIEWMLRRLDADVRRFVEMKWIGVWEKDAGGRERERRYEDAEIEKALGVSSRTLRRWKQEVVGMVAGRLGLLV